jgi:hypothetical protein
MDSEDLSVFTNRLTTSLDWIANALHHPNHQDGGLVDEAGGHVLDVSSAIAGVTKGLFAIAESIDGLADAVAGQARKEVSDD